ncbi:MAG: AAA family ATPase [Acidobacteria bacterium]|nr:AAA family ATPase [Acidobacteriota bacterium]
MLNRVTVSGYKSLDNATLQFAPFSVIVGRNNVGKSNLFDALRLLSHFAQMPAAAAFKPELHRGDPIESFFSEETPVLSIICDLDLSHSPHPFEADERLSHPYLHYELTVEFRKGTLVFSSETLEGKTKADSKGTPKAFIKSAQNDKTKVSLNRDKTDGGKVRQFPFPSSRSILSFIDDAELYPHVVALAQELRSWRFFHFEPDVLREPSPSMDIPELEPNGRGLSGFYDTLLNRNPDRFQSAERALRRAIPEVENIKLLPTGDRRKLLAIVKKDKREFGARVLSDGTLRFLALLALAYAPQPPGLICFEEPENGVHPARLPFIVDTLRGISQRGLEVGARSQVIVNSHSPYLVDLLEPEEMIVAQLNGGGRTVFSSVGNDLFSSKPALKEMLITGETTLGEIWAQGSLDAKA